MKVGKFELRLSATLLGLLFLIAVSIQAGLALAQQPIAKQTYVYKTAKGLDIKADVYRPAGGRVTPAIMWIHGGALIFGGRNGIRPYQLERYLAAGYTVVAIDYRLAPETKLPAILEDVQDAYGWLHKTAAELRIDPTRIGIVGHSAGGYLALMAGFALNPRPQVIVAFYGYGDVAGAWYSQPDPYYLKQPLIPQAEAEATVGTAEVSEVPAGNKRRTFYVHLRQQGLWPQRVTGLDPKRDGAALDRFCPARNLTPQYPPTLLLHGDADTDVPFQQSVDMNEALTREKIPHDFIQLHGKGHGFDRDSADPDVIAAFNRAVEFLNARLHPAQTGADDASAPGGTTDDEAAIRKIVADGTDAWNRRDAKGLVAHFSEDIDHIGVQGLWRSNRAELEKGFTAGLPTTRNDMSSSVERIRFLTPDVAVVVVRREYSHDKEARNAISTSVFQKVDGNWQVAAFQNTYVHPQGSPEAAEVYAQAASQSPLPHVEPEVKTPTNPERTSASKDEAAIRKIIADGTDAWNRRDAKAMAAHQSEDHDQIGVYGGWAVGRAQFEKALTAALATTRNNMTSSIAKIRFLTPDVAVVIVRREYTNDKETRKSISTSVIHKIDGLWWNEAFQNTYVRPTESTSSANPREQSEAVAKAPGTSSPSPAQSGGLSRAAVKMIPVGKANIEVFIRGAGPAVVLLPSIGGASQFDEFAPLLSAAGFQTIALSFRGAGRSTGPMEGLTLHDYAADVAGVIESLGVAPAHVLGRAGGNRVARCLASDRPQLVKSLILIAAGGLTPPSDPKAVAWLNGGPEAVPEPQRPAAFRTAMLSPATDPARVNHIMTFFPSWPAAAKAFFSANAATPVSEWWAGGSAPLLVIQGLDDLLAPPGNGRALREQFEGRVKLVEIPDGGHALMFEQPERVAAEVVAFLKATENTAAAQYRKSDVTLNGLRFHYLEWGNKSSPAMLVIPGHGGGGGCAESSAPFASAMRDRYHVYAMEQRGQCDSEWAKEYTWQRVVEDIDAFVDAFHLAPVTIVGHSSGAVWGYLYAAQHPEKVARLVAVEGGGHLPKTRADAQQRAATAAPQVTFSSPEEAVNYAKTHWRTDPSLDDAVREWILHGIRKLDDGRWGWRQDPASMAATLQFVFMPIGDELNAALPRIKCPTLTVRGSEGGLSRELAAERSRAIPNGKWVEIPNTTHTVQETNLAGFLAAVRDFLVPK